jgi:predicted lipoprotein with Yx(FWY)xxD motif
MRGKAVVATAFALSLVMSAASFAQYRPYTPRNVKTRKIGSTLVFVNDEDMTLYTFDRDSGGQSTCNGPCAKTWAPLPARSEHNLGSWSMIRRDDGSKQWAYRGKPVYTFAQDKAPGDAKGDNAGPKGTHLWHVIKAQ